MSEKIERPDYGTPEIARHFTVVPKLTRGSFGMNNRVMDETLIDILLLQGVITAQNHSSLEGFMRRLHKVGFVGLKSPTYDGPLSADPSLVGDRRANIVRGMVKIFQRLDKKMGADKRRALVNLVLLDAPWPGTDDELRASIQKLDDAIAGR